MGSRKLGVSDLTLDGHDSARVAALEHRWQRVAVPVAAALFMLLVLAGSSFVAMAHRETERVEGRTGLLASEPSPTDLVLIERDDKWHGEQFPVVWIEPAGAAKPVLPPGMGRLPKPGQAVVSPGLDRLASRHPGLAARYLNRLVLGMGGVASGDELLAYVRVPEGRSLSGDIRAVRVRAFGSPSGEDDTYVSYPTSGLVPVGAAVRGVLGFLVFPGLFVLAVGLAAPSGVRAGRSVALLLAVPGLVGVTVLWGAVSPLVGRIPLVGHDVLRGDLALPWWLLLAELGACVMVISLMPILMSAIRRRRMAEGRVGDPPSRRPRLLPATSTGVALAVLSLAVFSFAALSYSGTFGGNTGTAIRLAGIIAAIAGMLLILLGALREAGARLGRLESAPAQAAGMYIERDPVGTARPFLGVIAIVVIALVAGGYFTTTRDVEASLPSTGGTQAVFVEWLDPRPDDPARLTDALGAGLVVPFGEGEHTHHQHGHTHGDALVLGTTCRQLVTYFPGTTCSLDAPYELPEWTEQRLSEVTAMASHDPDSGVRLGPVDDVAASGSAIVLDEAPLKVLESRVRDIAMRALPAPHVYSLLSNALHAFPTTPWIVGGFAVAIVVLSVGCLISLAGHLLDTRALAVRKRRCQLLLSLGVSPHRCSSLEAWRFAAPYGVVVAVSFLAGLVACAAIVKPFLTGIPMPWLWIGATLAIAVVTGIVGTALAAFLGDRTVRRNLE